MGQKASLAAASSALLKVVESIEATPVRDLEPRAFFSLFKVQKAACQEQGRLKATLRWLLVHALDVSRQRVSWATKAVRRYPARIHKTFAHEHVI